MIKSSGLTRLILDNRTIGSGAISIPQDDYIRIVPTQSSEADFNIGSSSYTVELWYKPNILSYPIPSSYSSNFGSNIWRRFYNRTTGAFLYEDMGPTGTMNQAALPGPVQSVANNLRINYSGYFTTFSSDPPITVGIHQQTVAGIGFGSAGIEGSISRVGSPDLSVVATITYDGGFNGSVSQNFNSTNNSTDIYFGTRPFGGSTPWSWSIPLNSMVYFSCDVYSKNSAINGLSTLMLGTGRPGVIIQKTNIPISPELRYLIPYNQAAGYIVGKSNADTGWCLLHVNQSIQLFNQSPTFPVFDGTPSYNRSITTGSVINDTNKWYHIAAVQDSSLTTNNIKIFVDGILQAQGTLVGVDSFVNNSAEFRIGRSPAHTAYGAPYPSSHGLNGYIENLKITRGIAKYNSNFTPTVFG